jgi:uncharacterized protein (DUF58 family)
MIGWLLGWPELAVPGAAVTAIFVVGVVATLGGPVLTVSLTAAHRRVAVGGDPGVQVTVVSRARRWTRPHGLSLALGDPSGEGRGERSWPLPCGRLGPGVATVVPAAVPTSRRGLVRIGPVLTVRGDPLGLVARTWSWGQPLDIAVYPATVLVPVSSPGLARDIEGQPTGHPAEANVSFHALRPYQLGDDVRSVHWRSSARLGKLVVRQSEDNRRVRLALIVATDRAEYQHEHDFELAVSAYASIGLAQLNRSGDLAVIANGAMSLAARTGPGPLLDRAAMIRLGEGEAHSLAWAAAQSVRSVPSATLALLVTGTKLSERELGRIAAGLPPGESALALRCQVGAQLGLSRVGRLGLATVGSLADLPKALRGLGLR